MTRFYVTMTWHDWPEGGSYGTVIEASNHDEAEALCRMEMAHCEDGGVEIPEDATEDEADALATEYIEEMEYEWHVVDCFDLDHFIESHRRKES